MAKRKPKAETAATDAEILAVVRGQLADAEAEVKRLEAELAEADAARDSIARHRGELNQANQTLLKAKQQLIEEFNTRLSLQAELVRDCRRWCNFWFGVSLGMTLLLIVALCV